MTNQKDRLLTDEELGEIFGNLKRQLYPTEIRLADARYFRAITEAQDTQSVKAIIDNLDLLVKTGHFNRLTFEEFLQALKRSIDDKN